MAKISKVVKNEKRKKMVANYAARRAALKKTINNPLSSIEQVDAAIVGLQKLPRDASPIRVLTAVRKRAIALFLRKFAFAHRNEETVPRRTDPGCN